MILTILILGSAAAYVYFNPSAHNRIDKLKAHLPLNQSSRVYKWQDREGNWQISDTPPAGNIPYQTLDYPHDANLIPAETLTGKPSD